MGHHYLIIWYIVIEYFGEKDRPYLTPQHEILFKNFGSLEPQAIRAWTNIDNAVVSHVETQR